MRCFLRVILDFASEIGNGSTKTCLDLCLFEYSNFRENKHIEYWGFPRICLKVGQDCKHVDTSAPEWTCLFSGTDCMSLLPLLSSIMSKVYLQYWYKASIPVNRHHCPIQ